MQPNKMEHFETLNQAVKRAAEKAVTASERLGTAIVNSNGQIKRALLGNAQEGAHVSTKRKPVLS